MEDYNTKTYKAGKAYINTSHKIQARTKLVITSSLSKDANITTCMCLIVYHFFQFWFILLFICTETD